LILSPVSPITASVNLAGLPAAALPCGFDKQGLPIGFQLTGSVFSENKIINASRIYQQRTSHHIKKPFAFSAPQRLCEKKEERS